MIIRPIFARRLQACQFDEADAGTSNDTGFDDWVGECDICNIVDWLNSDGLCDDCSERGDPALRSSVAKRGAMPLEESLRKYGIGFQDWERLFGEQGYACAICRSEFPRTGRGVWHTDHDVERNLGIIFVRGILCVPCNIKLATTKSTWTQDKRFVAYVLNPTGRAFGVHMSGSELM